MKGVPTMNPGEKELILIIPKTFLDIYTGNNCALLY